MGPRRATTTVLVVTALAVATLLAVPGIAAADHPAVGGATFAPAGGTGINSGGEGAEWEHLGSFTTGNPHSDLDFFTQGGITYASVGTIAAGGNSAGQTIVQLTDEDGAVAPSFVAGHPSATCITDPASALGLQHDVEATPKGDVPLNTDWGDLAVREDAQLLIDASDAPGRCHDGGLTGQGLLDAPQGGLELIDITDVTAPVEIALVSHIGESHTVNVDPSRPHIVYSVTSDSIGVAADADDCDDDGDTGELIRGNECGGLGLDGFEVLDISSCLDFPADATTEDKRGIAADGGFAEDEGCRPLVYRYRYDDLDMALGHTNTGSIYGCHELEVFPDDTLTCAGGAALMTFDISGMFDDAGTPEDRTDDTINGDPLPCRLRASTSGPDRATGAPVLDCVQGGTDTDPIDLSVAGWIEAGAPSVAGVEHIASAYHMGRESTTGSADPSQPATEDIDFNHEAEFTHSGDFVLTTDERGGGVLPPGATCVQGVDNTAGNGGIHAYATDRLLAERPEPVTTAEESSFDPEVAFESYARTPADPETGEGGDKAIYRAPVRTGAQATICTAHVFHQIPGQNRIFMGWYSQGTQVVDYIEHPDGTFEFTEVAWFIPEAADQWVSAIFDITENTDGTWTYTGATGDFRLTEGGRNAIDIYSVTLPAPAQFAGGSPIPIERIDGSGAIDTAIAVSVDAFGDGAPVALLGRVDDYADNLAGGPLAADLGAPLLYTPTDALDPATEAEIERLGAEEVVILGGVAAVSQAVEDALVADGLTVRRIGGENRFETAALIAAELGSATGTAFVVEGEHTDPARGWPDPVSVAPYAGFRGDPILLVNRDRLPEATTAALTDLGVDEVVIAGGDAAVSAAVEQGIADGAGVTTRRLAGDTRYQTSLAVYDEAVAEGMDPGALTLATGLDWPQALAAGPQSAIAGTSFALIDGQGGADELEALLTRNREALRLIRLVGDTSTITAEVEDAIVAILLQTAPAEDAEPQTAGVASLPRGDAALVVGAVALLALAIRRRRRTGGQLG